MSAEELKQNVSDDVLGVVENAKKAVEHLARFTEVMREYGFATVLEQRRFDDAFALFRRPDRRRLPVLPQGVVRRGLRERDVPSTVIDCLAPGLCTPSFLAAARQATFQNVTLFHSSSGDRELLLQKNNICCVQWQKQRGRACSVMSPCEECIHLPDRKCSSTNEEIQRCRRN